MTTYRLLTSLCLFGFGSLAACSGAQQSASKVAAAAKNAASPIVGSWEINGDTPQPEPNLPQFVRLHFRSDGKLDASYVAAGGALAGIVKTSAKLKSERDSYTLDGHDHLSIVEGSRSLDYTFRVRDGKLFLTPKDATNAIVYAQSGDGS